MLGHRKAKTSKSKHKQRNKSLSNSGSSSSGIGVTQSKEKSKKIVKSGRKLEKSSANLNKSNNSYSGSSSSIINNNNSISNRNNLNLKSKKSSKRTKTSLDSVKNNADRSISKFKETSETSKRSLTPSRSCDRSLKRQFSEETEFRGQNSQIKSNSGGGKSNICMISGSSVEQISKNIGRNNGKNFQSELNYQFQMSVTKSNTNLPKADSKSNTDDRFKICKTDWITVTNLDRPASKMNKEFKCFNDNPEEKTVTESANCFRGSPSPTQSKASNCTPKVAVNFKFPKLKSQSVRHQITSNNNKDFTNKLFPSKKCIKICDSSNSPESLPTRGAEPKSIDLNKRRTLICSSFQQNNRRKAKKAARRRQNSDAPARHSSSRNRIIFSYAYHDIEKFISRSRNHVKTKNKFK